MIKRRLILFVAIFLFATGVSAQDYGLLKKDVEALSSPEMEGRAPGSKGHDMAADYIESSFKTAGLLPSFGSSMRQSFPMITGLSLTESNAMSFAVVIEKLGIPLDKTKPTPFSWKIGRDYQPYGFSENGSVEANMIFVGFGIAAPKAGYDDYARIDVKGQVVVCLAGLPPWASKNEAFRLHSSVRAKATTAREKGAIAVIIVNQQGDMSDVLTPFGMDRLGRNSGILAVQARRTPVARLFTQQKNTLVQAEEKIVKSRKPLSFVLERVTVSLTVEMHPINAEAVNIAGIVRGKHPTLSNEYLVVGAHFDHLGYGDENSLHPKSERIIHPGADDNASGTAGVMDLARRIAASPLDRSVIFVAFSGEEKGLLGSKFFVDNPAVPLSSITGMINLDMIGRMSNSKLNVQGTGTSNQWDSILTAATSDLGLTLGRTADGIGPSDHSSFALKKIPVLFFFTGLHSDYHRPGDTHDKINYQGINTVVSVAERVLRGIGTDGERLEFNKLHGSTTPTSSGGGFRVVFGVIPDYSDNDQGLLISGTREGTPAHHAGLQDGDIITRFGSTEVKNIYDLTSALGNYDAGDVVDVVFLRGNASQSVKVTLVGRP